MSVRASASIQLDVLVTDPLSGRTTGLARTVRRAIKAMQSARVPYCVIGAAALAVRGLPRMTRDLDLAVLSDDSARAIAALRGARFSQPLPADEDEAMIVFADAGTRVEVDLLIASGNPEARIIAEAPRARIFGAHAPVATLEHLLLLYLYSNQPKHLGDFASIVQSGRADLRKAERTLAEIHPEMVRAFKRRVAASLSPPPAPRRPD